MASKIEQKELKLFIDGFLKGDSNQFNVIKTKITQYTYHQKLSSNIDRDEIISEILEILYDTLRKGKFRGDNITALNSYIYNIIKFRIYRVFRRTSRLEYNEDIINIQKDESSSPSENVGAKDLAEKILSLIGEKCRKLLHLKFRKDWSDQEIADHLKKSKNSTSTAISRCLQKAKDLNIVQELM